MTRRNSVVAGRLTLPDSSLVVVHERAGVVDPVRESDTDDDQDLEETSQTTSNVGRGDFRDKGGTDGGFDTDTETSEETTGVLVAEGHSCRLEDTPDSEDDTTDQDGVFPADGIVHGSGSQSTEETTSLEDRDDIGLDVRHVGGITGDAHVPQEGRLSDNTSSQAGVVTEQNDTETRRQH